MASKQVADIKRRKQRRANAIKKEIKFEKKFGQRVERVFSSFTNMYYNDPHVGLK